MIRSLYAVAIVSLCWACLFPLNLVHAEFGCSTSEASCPPCAAADDLWADYVPENGLLRQVGFMKSKSGKSDCCYDGGCDALPGGAGSFCESGSCLSGSAGYWKLHGGALFMMRTDPDNELLLRSDFDPTRNVRASQFDFDITSGYEVSLHRGCASGCELQLRHFSLGSWSDSLTSNLTPNVAPALIPFDNTLINAAPPIAIVGPRIASATYGSDLANYEINLRSPSVGDNLHLLIGFRHLTLNEQIDARLAATAANPGLLPIDLQSMADNNLFGMQLGSEVRLFESAQLFRAGGLLKAGVYGVDAQHRSSIAGGGFQNSLGNSDTAAAFLGELMLDASLRLGPMALKMDYRMMWIEGVAMAGDQITASGIDPLLPQPNIDTSGGAFYHGFQVGLEATF